MALCVDIDEKERSCNVFVLLFCDENEEGRGKWCFCKSLTEAISASPNRVMASSAWNEEDGEDVSYAHALPMVE